MFWADIHFSVSTLLIFISFEWLIELRLIFFIGPPSGLFLCIRDFTSCLYDSNSIYNEHYYMNVIIELAGWWHILFSLQRHTTIGWLLIHNTCLLLFKEDLKLSWALIQYGFYQEYLQKSPIQWISWPWPGNFSYLISFLNFRWKH